MDTQSLYQKAIRFAAEKHLENNQKVPGTNMPYGVHLSNVAMEIMIASFYTDNFDLNFAVQLALLHDVLEDTSTKFEELEKVFGKEIAIGVLALTKNENLLKEEKMLDALKRIKLMSKEVWAVKLADRITNLQVPPTDWDNSKKVKYLLDAELILSELREGNEFLAVRLKNKIKEYRNYIDYNETVY